MSESVGVRYSYLSQQFCDYGHLWNELRKFVSASDFTSEKKLVSLTYEKKIVLAVYLQRQASNDSNSLKDAPSLQFAAL